MVCSRVKFTLFLPLIYSLDTLCRYYIILSSSKKTVRSKYFRIIYSVYIQHSSNTCYMLCPFHRLQNRLRVVHDEQRVMNLLTVVFSSLLLRSPASILCRSSTVVRHPICHSLKHKRHRQRPKIRSRCTFYSSAIRTWCGNSNMQTDVTFLLRVPPVQQVIKHFD